MKHRLNRSRLSETMALTLAVWLCSLVVIGLFVVPLVGLKIAGIVALGLLVVLLAICWSLCAYRLMEDGDQPLGLDSVKMDL